MTASSLYSTHVAEHTRHRKPIGYHFCVGARAGGRAPRVNCGPMYQNLTEILPAPILQSVVALRLRRDGVITALSYQGGVNWWTAIERPQTFALAVRRFLQWGRTGLLNFCRAKAPGKPSLLPLVHDANQPTCGFFHRFEVSKILSSSALHANNKAWSRPNEVQRKSVPSASGAEHEFG